MTESEWLACIDPSEMVAHVREMVSERKLRLFSCAWLHQLRPLLVDPKSRAAVEVAERFADDLADVDELSKACDDADVALRALPAPQRGEIIPIWTAARLAHWTCVEEAVEGVDEALLSGTHVGMEEPERLQVVLLHDLLGNPFRPVPAATTLRISTVVGMAQTIYDNRAFDRMPVLADALEEAGCDDEAILGHCRGPGPHVRGCWVVDLLLGKE